MVTEKQLRDLLDTWKSKFNNINTEEAFDVLYDCVCDVAGIICPKSAESFCNLVMATMPDRAEEEALREMEADSYLSTIEAHERV